MRALLSVVLCLSVVVCISANLELGQRQEGDHVIANEIINKPAIFQKTMKVNFNRGVDSNEMISYINVNSLNGNEINARVMRGGVGMNYVKLLIFGKPSEGLHIKVEIHSKNRA